MLLRHELLVFTAVTTCHVSAFAPSSWPSSFRGGGRGTSSLPEGWGAPRIRGLFYKDGRIATDDVRRVVESVPSRGYVRDRSSTPVEYMPRLTASCADGPQLYVKRDDLLPLAGGGSKTRKLDYLMQDALDAGADVVVTCGAVQSNHCRLTASAAAREGLECHLILEERVEGSYDDGAGGNNYAFELLGAKKRRCAAGGVADAERELVGELEAEGKKVYAICGGGSNAMGALGYVRCATEIIEQSEELKRDHGEEGEPGLFWDAIVTCSGSGGTHTGLLTGLRAAGFDTPVVGVSVRFDADTQSERIREQCRACVDEYFSGDRFDHLRDGGVDEDVVVVDDQVGPGYSLYTEEMARAVQEFARRESILLDPVYTGKGAAAFLAIARSGRFTPEQRILFVHTGGAPSLFHYQTRPSASDYD